MFYGFDLYSGTRQQSGTRLRALRWSFVDHFDHAESGVCLMLSVQAKVIFFLPLMINSFRLIKD